MERERDCFMRCGESNKIVKMEESGHRQRSMPKMIHDVDTTQTLRPSHSVVIAISHRLRLNDILIGNQTTKDPLVVTVMKPKANQDHV